ncbi:hypothetical protein SSBG_01962 [Streptomyces sp. SPB074]|nr:hypothetical protein SSBG_01962 [Streptomyces sp. SPB074]
MLGLHLEELASRAESYPHVVPGLLQTRACATAIPHASPL